MHRRPFLSSCAAHVAALLPFTRGIAWTAPGARVVRREPFGRLEQVADGVWALVSTPLGGDFTTVANGGIVAGRDGVLVVEGLFRPAGAQWLAEQAQSLTGRWPTHVAITHYHADHANGVPGYQREGGDAPAIYVTGVTRRLAMDRNTPSDPARLAALGASTPIDAARETAVDLGGRTVTLTPLDGHTASDLVVTVDEPRVVFSGDLFWNAMFPNYVDAVPSRLAAAARRLRAMDTTRWVPGHGPLAGAADLDRYLTLLDLVEDHARRSRQAGATPAEAAGALELPPSLGEWALFNRSFFERAMRAWYGELGGA